MPKVVKHCNDMNPICIDLDDDNIPAVSSTISDNQWVPELGLTTSDRNILLHPTAWLNDRIIDAAQKLIKILCPAIFGLQTVSNCQTMGFDIQPDEFLQILNNGNHWLTVSTVGAAHPTVKVYDSIYSNAGPEIQALIASLLATTRGEIIANFIDVPFQSGCNDCGLFAIAYAVTIALGLRPEEYQFEQAGMRAHMLRCLEAQKIEMFPVLRRRRVKDGMVRAMQRISVHCTCRMPKMNNKMIKCSLCEEWFHLSTCVTVPASTKSRNITWLCDNCTMS